MKQNKNKIDRLYIACYRGDYWQTKICVASVRKWYPEIPIFLIKDLAKGDFNTSEMEKNFNVQIANFNLKKFGWGVSKFEPYFLDEDLRCLILDSDIIFLGKVIDYLEEFSEDFVISEAAVADVTSDIFKRNYYNLDLINEQFDPNFTYPNYVFNTGQLVCNTHIFKRADLSDFIHYDQNVAPTLKHRKVFACADQGILNYLLPKKERLKEITVGRLILWYGVIQMLHHHLILTS